MKHIVIKAPERKHIHQDILSVFLAGSIEMGTAENWQDKVIDGLSIHHRIAFLNPRRDDWDSTWTQDLNNPQFYDQVTWELNMLNKADIIVMYFDPNTKSPISLLELGLYAGSGKLIVCCPDGFWRKGNVDIVCQRFNIPVFTNIETLLMEVKNQIN